MELGDKLFKTGGWSSKKYNGTLLVIFGVLLAVAALICYALNSELEMLMLMLPSGSLLTSGLACFGVDAVNKKTKNNALQTK